MQLFGVTEPLWRLAAFLSVFAAMAVLELWHPRLERPELQKALKARRWLTNLSILVLSSLSLRLIFPVAATGAALWAGARGYGLLPALSIPPLVAGVIAFVVLDFAIWLEHVAFHKVPLFWRMHRVHHADPGVDLTTALRFHPLEIIVSMAWKIAIIVALGAPAVAVLLFEIVLNAAAMFNHANLRLPPRLDRALRPLIVTPDMHRIHHSTERSETDSNYGFNLAIWDRLFSTYTDRPRRGDEAIETGLTDYGRSAPTRLLWSLLLPFRRN